MLAFASLKILNIVCELYLVLDLSRGKMLYCQAVYFNIIFQKIRAKRIGIQILDNNSFYFLVILHKYFDILKKFNYLNKFDKLTAIIIILSVHANHLKSRSTKFYYQFQSYNI